ncbi:MAG: hypothetical protein J0M04_03625 [Verrucomicrobia bacterium]|nr:hypothetical protein [Verrucomicrobiota bacterium]
MNHHVIRLPDGRVMLIGGHGLNFEALGSTDTYDPVSNSFTMAALPRPCDYTTMARLQDGRILLAGGSLSGGVPSYSTAMLFNPADNTWSASGTMSRQRSWGGAATLSDGRVLFAGAWYGDINSASAYSDLFNPATLSFTSGPPLAVLRCLPVVLPAANGKAVVVGGYKPYGGTSHSARHLGAYPELYDPVQNSFTSLGGESLAGQSGWSVIRTPDDISNYRLNDGRYLLMANRIVGEVNEVGLFLFNPDDQTFSRLNLTPAPPNGWTGFALCLNPTRTRAHLLMDKYAAGELLWIWATVDPATGSAELPPSPFSPLPSWFTHDLSLPMAATATLGDGRIMIAGGTSGDNFHPVNGTRLVNPGAEPPPPPQPIADGYTVPEGTVETVQYPGWDLEPGTLWNNGTIALRGTTDPASIFLTGQTTVAGSGILSFEEGAFNRITATGAGEISLAATQTLRVLAGAGGSITAPMHHAGALNVAGALQLASGEVSGPFNLVSGSSVRLNEGTFAVAGPLNLASGAVLRADSLGTLVLAGGTREINGTLLVAGRSTAASEPATGTSVPVGPGSLRLEGPVHLTGSGVLQLGQVSGDTSDRIEAANGATLSLGSSFTFATGTAAGNTLGVDPALTNHGAVAHSGGSVAFNGPLDNRGTIMIHDGSVLLENATAANSGSIEVDPGGTLVVHNADLDNNGGLICLASDGPANGSLTLDGGIVRGGTISGSGALGSTAAGGTLRGVSITANLMLNGLAPQFENCVFAPSATLGVGGGGILAYPAGTHVNDITILLDSGPGSNGTATLRADGAAVIAGSGRVRIGASSGNTISAINGGSFTFAASQGFEVTSGGSVLVSAPLATAGSVDVDGGHLTYATAAKTNSGTIGVRGAGAWFKLDGITLDNTGGTITGDSGCDFLMNGATFKGGTLSHLGLSLSGTNTIDSAELTDSVFNIGSQMLRMLGTATFGPAVTATLGNGGVLSLGGDSLVCNGLIELAGTSANATLVADGAAMLGGNGRIVFKSPNASRNILETANGGSLTLGAGQTLTTAVGGSGYVRAALTNHGLIDATGSGSCITFDTTNLANGGTITATDGGRLSFAAITIDNTGGTIGADSGSTLQLSGTTVNGGSLDGILSMTGTTAGLRGATLLADARISADAAGKILTISDVLTNNGAVELANNSHGNGIHSTLRCDGAATLNGSGSLVFNNSDAAGANVIDAIHSGSLTNGSNHTLRALAGKNGHVQLAVTNNGMIEAIGSGAGIYFDTINPVNRGTIRATGGGTITFLPATIDNTGGIISADDTSTVQVTNTTIIGGVLDARVSNSGTGITLQDTTLAETARIDVYDFGFAKLRGTVTNNGIISVKCISYWADPSYWARLRVDGPVTLAGTGSVVFNNTNGPNLIEGVNNGTLTLGSSQTLTTLAGRSGSVNLSLINRGTVDAAGTGSSISIGAGTTNSGTMRATNAGTLGFGAVTVDNTGGTITTDATGVVQLNSTVVTGGTIGGSIQCPFGTLQNLTIAPNVQLPLWQGQTAVLKGTVINQGTIRLAGSAGAPSAFARLRCDGPVVVGGTGTIVFDNSAGGNAIEQTNNGTLTLSEGVTLTTMLGRSGSVIVPLINRGTVDATGAGSGIGISAAVTNTSVMRATNAGTLGFGAVTVDNTGGLITTGTTGLVQLNGTVVTGGSFGGSTSISGNSTIVRDAAILSGGKISTIGGNKLTLQGTIDNNGVIELANHSRGAGFATLCMDGAVTLNGGGVMLCNNTDLGGINLLNSVNNGSLTLGASQTMRAMAGHNGYVRVPLTNGGMIEASGTGSYFWFDTCNPANRSTMRALDGGAFYLSSITLDNAGGMLATDATGSVQMSASTVVGGSIGGNVVVNTWVTPTATLRDVTITPEGKVTDKGSNTTLTLQGAIVNDGTIEVANTYHGSALATLRMDGPVTLNGGGVILFNNTDLGGVNLLNSVNSGSLTLGASQTMRVMAGHNGYIRTPLTNGGMIEASGTGGYFAFDTCNPTNRGTIRALDNGAIYFTSITVDNTGGLIATDGTGTVNLISSTINGGEISGKLVFTNSKLVCAAIGEGSTGVAGTTIVFEQSAAVVPGGTLLIGNNGTVTFNKASGTGIITNDGLIRLSNPAATGGTAKLQYTGPLTLAGSGVLEFAPGSSNLLTPTNAADPLTNGPGHTIAALAGSTATLAASLANQGTFITNATTFNLGTSGAQITNAGNFQIQSGTVNLTGSSFVNQESGTLSGNGTLKLNGATFTNAGIVSPGNSPGVLSITGDFHQSATGDLVVEINGSSPGSFDVLAVSGTAWLAGDLVVKTGPGYVFHANDSFRILTANAVTGQFSRVVFAQGTARADYQSDGVTVTILSVATAYDMWTATAGLTGADAAASADPDHDGVPNILEFVLGGEPNPLNPGSNSRALLPTATAINGDLVFSFRRKNRSEGLVAITFQWSSTLDFGATDQILIGPTSSESGGVTVAVENDTPDADTDTITVTVPAIKASGARLFGRLGATMP